MQFLDHDIRLAIFDLDGTLLQSTSLWSDIDVAFFAKRGMDVPDQYGINIVHMGLEEGAQWTTKTFFPNEKPEDIIAEWRMMSQKAYEEEIPLAPFAKETLEAMASFGVKLAVATANSKELYEPCLKRLQIFDYFEEILDVNTINASKRSSKIYDELTSRFHVKKENVIVFEDALEAMSTAYKAGYLTVGIFDPFTTKDEEAGKANCNIFIKQWREFLDLLH